MLKVGLTGGIGSGKTTVCKIFNALGIPIYYADKRAAYLTRKNPNIQYDITRKFGAESYINGIYNKKYISKLVFNNTIRLQTLNNIIHPHVAKDFNKWLFQHIHFKYIIKESAILFETKTSQNLDSVIVVDTPHQLRIKRILARDDITESEILKRIKSQWPAEKKRALADWIIENNENQLILPQVLRIHKKLLNKKLSDG